MQDKVRFRAEGELGAGKLGCDRNRLGVDIHDVLNIEGVPAGHGDRGWDFTLFCKGEDHSVTGCQAEFGQLQSAQSIVFEGIGASEVDHEIVGAGRIALVESRFERGQVGSVRCSVWEVDIERAWMFPQRKVFFAVDRASKNVKVVAENVSRPVSLVDIAIHHESSTNRSFVNQVSYGDGGIVEDTKTFTGIVHRMVSSSRHVDCESVG